MKRKITRKPTTPGEILHEEFLEPLGLTQKSLADHLGCDIKVINRIVNGRCAVTAETALKLGAALGTTPGFWLSAQEAVDIYEASKRISKLPKRLPHLATG
jgi:addiction module HigA family antidote